MEDPRNVISFDDGQSATEGWGLFMLDTADVYGKRLCAIQAADETDTFRDDFQALAFVLNTAMDGSQYHRDALSLHLGCELRKGFEEPLKRMDLSGPVALTLENADYTISVIARFSCIDNAENFLNEHEGIDPVALEAGRYGIEAPHGVGSDDEALQTARRLGYDGHSIFEAHKYLAMLEP